MTDRVSESTIVQHADRLSWPRHVDGGHPIVGWICQHCGHELEAPYKPTLLRKCPSCGGNQAGVRLFEVEPFVEGQRRRLSDQLAARYLPGDTTLGETDHECAACGATEDVHLDPDESLTNFEWRCDDHLRLGRWWWMPGDHPSLLTRQWIATCDDCGAEFTDIFGVTFCHVDPYGDQHQTTTQCLRCADGAAVRRQLEQDRGESA